MVRVFSSPHHVIADFTKTSGRLLWKVRESHSAQSPYPLPVYNRVFGYESFGTVYGLVNSVGGISQLLLRPLDVFVKGLVLGGNYNIPNSFGLGLGVLASGVSSFIIWNGTRRTRVE
jgi:hypothetical protein